MIEGLKAQGITIFLTTQYLEEAERLADSVVILDKGRIVKTGTVNQIKENGSLEEAFLKIVGE
jgi:ABC-type multidrug transport system ATPase subunit